MEAFLTSFLNSYQTHISGFHQNSVFAKPGIIGFCALDVLVVFMLASSSNLGQMSINDRSGAYKHRFRRYFWTLCSDSHERAAHIPHNPLSVTSGGKCGRQSSTIDY